MDQTLSGINGSMAYLDDILVAGRTHEEHDQLEETLRRLQTGRFRLNLFKCQ